MPRSRRSRALSAHPSNQIDDVVHQRTRLGILTVLAESRRTDFRTLRELLELTDGNLARHIQVLEEAGYVKQKKESGDGRPRTWISITAAGRKALAREVASLRALIEIAGG